MNVNITGVSGFVGKNLSAYLANNTFSITSISLRDKIWKQNLDGDAIIHLAGKAHDTKNISDASEYFTINTELTKELFDFFLESHIKDFIYFSSVKAVADEVLDILFEDVQASPNTPYGKSKLQAEEYILSKVIPRGKRVFIIRPCMIHGPGNKGNLNLLYNVVKKGIPYPLGAFHNERSFLGIENLNFMIKQILDNKNISSGIYNFADDEVLSTNELIKIISTVINKRKFLLHIPKVIINGAAKIGDFVKLPLNSETVQKLTENYRVSNHKIKRAIGIENLPNTARKGLEKTIESFMEKK
ncbi:NAD-dependent epimerase/dehydratase family protein [Flavobacterium sp. Fl-318]|uniref:NAD-dependent epimerase/dehydratase family protein n=1 Tax=Flavobacterium cupriresistens TaxID=2893885 RepID=A0ABU4RDQ7_9FLAO|nr:MULTISPECIES: NAD-dependent epimerase/dehydratase family protein [unclassified Flavobacterium]MDX6190113.1 NAD-dependent epimerase/dehydratase family protein [Flavobacterium sp. Fl-318]UFH42934.1 NAD-dependent epimerase/dehydratase family protein [Flavobacterium sp. F-323]